MIPIRIAIVDDSAEFRKATRFFLEQIPDFIIVGEAQNGKEFVELTKNSSIDIALMDIKMPEMDGISATYQIAKTHYPYLKIIALSMHNDMENLRAMIEAGAMGYIQKEDVFTHLEKAIRSVASNKHYYGKL
ncbi:MAG: response regulator transcription factor [Bacteroidales bacterium]|nr:response regulator transcription factor [Bacteroidales bacterium]